MGTTIKSYGARAVEHRDMLSVLRGGWALRKGQYNKAKKIINKMVADGLVSVEEVNKYGHAVTLHITGRGVRDMNREIRDLLDKDMQYAPVRGDEEELL